MSVIENYPALRPTLLLDFANSGRVHPLVQCTRASTATCFGPDGKLRTVAANVPRVDYEQGTGKCLGLLAEEARTNLLLNSLTMATGSRGTSAAWATAPSVEFPGALSLIATGIFGVTYAGSAGAIYGGVSATASTSYTLSVYARLLPGSAVDKARLRISDSDGNNFYSLTTLTTDRLTLCSVAITTSATSNSISWAIGTEGGLMNVELVAYQLEVGGFPTSRIPTAAAAVTRAADLITLDYLLPSRGAIVSSVAGLSSASTSNAYVWSAINPADNSADHAYFYYPGGTQSTNWWTNKGGVGQSGGNVLGRRQNAGISFDAGTKTAAIASGSLFFQDESTRPRDFPGNLSQLLLGRSRANAGFLNGCISRLAVYSGRITNAQLQRLTA
ncbi:hypothetical protein GL58_18775 [Comamonas testosteroni]|uniref:Uncharacterized protein n=1 Tax=Comamonas testosteroni TaxID=285 RepID=A0A0L7MBJ8_COMTE|nr:hypothetical protein [Comamonas testosteroni]KOC19251.1 hypothetical protein GL58_18775 [Comamonas testosteroni]KWT72897.1 hypothetical protein APV28_1461 [Comamonas testosteroni]